MLNATTPSTMDQHSFPVAMAALDDYILILHSPDALQWSNFLSTRLATPQYGITSISKDLQTLTTAAFPSSAAHSNYNSAGKPNAESGKDADNRDSGRCSRNAITENSSISDCISNCKAGVVFISPDVFEADGPFPVDVTSLNPKSSVFLLLGVEIEETRAYFRDKSDFVFKCSMCVIDGSDKSICDAMLSIIQAFENQTGCDEDGDEKDIYLIPPSPKQRNGIVKVFPRELSEEDREVFILLERPAEDDVVVVLDADIEQEIPLNTVSDRLYSFQVPDDISGPVKFRIECKANCFGEETVMVYTKIGQLGALLTHLTDPLTLLTSALNLRPDDIGGLDTTLAFKLQQLAPASTFKLMFPCEDALNSTTPDETSKMKYPSLLHFAADLNLRAFCSELLHYPGMLGAACTENVDGLFPCQIAARKGYTNLEQDLIHFVEQHKGMCDESLYVPPEPILPVPATKPKHHSTRSPGYYNQPAVAVTSDYVPMANLNIFKRTLLDQQSMKSDSELMSPQSDYSDSVFGSSNSYTNISDLDVRSPALPSDSSQHAHETQVPTETGSPVLGKACKVLGVRQEDIVASSQTLSGNALKNLQDWSASAPGRIPIEHFGPVSSQTAAFDYKQDSPRRTSVSSNCDDPNYYISHNSDTKNRAAVKNKILSFFGKVRMKKSFSEDDGSTPTLKKSNSNRSTKSSRSATESVSGGSRKKKMISGDSPERDSGSYSDEEKPSPQTTKKSKARVFKERDRPMERTLSKRAQNALSEKVDNAPNLPKTDRRKGHFKSFIETDSKF
ncbi:unnamed protein product [Lymnaea stagnalis]|uniref:DBB domain-containing protein n=1 Tax=Lymnaea stagnalis TaxID=6523 RepID=A0AAV2H4T1_LYMST